MSRRVLTKAEMTDKGLAIQALTQAGIQFEEKGDNVLVLTSGSYKNARIDLSAGTVSGDSDYGHTEESFGVLRQYYGEAKAKAALLKSGSTIDERQVDQEGNIILMWHMN